MNSSRVDRVAIAVAIERFKCSGLMSLAVSGHQYEYDYVRLLRMFCKNGVSYDLYQFRAMHRTRGSEGLTPTPSVQPRPGSSLDVDAMCSSWWLGLLTSRAKTGFTCLCVNVVLCAYSYITLDKIAVNITDNKKVELVKVKRSMVEIWNIHVLYA
jgi:hypothetical protein